MEVQKANKGDLVISFYKGEEQILKAAKEKGWMLLVRTGDDLLIRSNGKKHHEEYILVSRYHLNVGKAGVHKAYKPGEIFITDNQTEDHYSIMDEPGYNKYRNKVDYLVQEGFFGIAGHGIGHWSHDSEKVRKQFVGLKTAIDGFLVKNPDYNKPAEKSNVTPTTPTSVATPPISPEPIVVPSTEAVPNPATAAISTETKNPEA